ncbi:mannosyltransferase B [Vibrio ishigakensis]|uniref:Mannosyltransferase B n=1 Tax=Vibrio ishigakensis TaxID=1481914 RepID=A0A0B8Q2S7_9VIBR|nr:mannosyltransferase B [Vibrio ishigakensis]
MKTIIINATGAKAGGAKQILLSCLMSIDQDEMNNNKYIVLSPLVEEDIALSSTNIELIRLSTSSIWTFLFSTFFVFLYALRYKSRTIISFNNVNAFFLKRWFDLTTYFHQLKAVESSEIDLRMKLIRKNISLLKGTTVIVQSHFVKKRFREYFGLNYEVIVAWPGIRKINQTCDSRYIYGLIEEIKLEYQYVAVWPVSMVYSPHKGFRVLWSLSKKLEKLNVAIVVPGI